MIVDCLQNTGQDQQKLQILLRLVARIEQIFSGIRADGPVVVLAGAVDTRIGFFVQQTYQAMFGGYPLHGLHGQLVLIHSHIGSGEDRGHLVLRRGHLVVLGGGRDTQLPQFHIEVLHERAHALADDAKVLIVHLLSLGGRRAEQRSARIDEVTAL